MPLANEPAGSYRTSVLTALGRLVIHWQQGPEVERISLPGTSRFMTGSEQSCPAIAELAEAVQAVAMGRKPRFDSRLLALSRQPRFRRLVLLAASRIPPGRVTGYSRLATAINRPGSARAVGTALARNPFPLLIPCHRVVRSDRTLGGYGGGLVMKRALLELEGVGFDTAGRVRPGFYR